MKKFLLVLGMITCMIGMTACGKQAEEAKPIMDEATATATAEYTVEQIAQIVSSGLSEQYAEDPVIAKALESWEKALADIGDYKQIVGSEAEIDDEQAIVNVSIQGTNHDAVVEVIMGKEAYTSITTNVTYSFGELMTKAGLNTLMGMGTVFVVLILISLIISCFNFIPKIQAKFSKKAEAPAPAPAAASVAAAAPAAEENLTDDLELVAVIAAAIAASEGAASTDGFVVRSIKRANAGKWQRA